MPRFVAAKLPAGEVAIPDLDIAAEQFIGGSVSHQQLRVALGISQPSQADIAARVDAAVDAFLATYGAPSKDRGAGDGFYGAGPEGIPQAPMPLEPARSGVGELTRWKRNASSARLPLTPRDGARWLTQNVGCGPSNRPSEHPTFFNRTTGEGAWQTVAHSLPSCLSDTRTLICTLAQPLASLRAQTVARTRTPQLMAP